MTSVDFHQSQELRNAGIEVALSAGATLFEQGDESDGAYVILAGSVSVVEGDVQVGVLEAGEFFGEMTALDESTRTATVVANSDAVLLRIAPRRLQETFDSNPDLYWGLFRTMMSRLRSIAARQVAYRDEHRALQEAQRTLLPDLDGLDLGTGSVEAIWEPCTYASGDYYDVIPLGGSRHLLVMGDVMGHGAQASLMMGIARAQVHELARSFRRTDELLLRLDGYLRDNAPARQGMSMNVAVYDSATSLLEYGSAGHPFPLLIRDGDVQPLPGRPGVLLSLPFLVGAGYERLEIELRPGDALLFFTDGLYEVPVDPDGTQLGTTALASIFAEAERNNDSGSLRAVFDEIARRDVGPYADDDRTALLLRV